MTSAVSWVAKMFEPSWPHLNPYFSQTADDKAWRHMQAEASQLEPSGAWPSTNLLTRSAQDRASCKWGTRSGGSKVVGEFQGIARLLLASALLLLAARAAARSGLSRSSAGRLVPRLLRDGSRTSYSRAAARSVFSSKSSSALSAVAGVLF